MSFRTLVSLQTGLAVLGRRLWSWKDQEGRFTFTFTSILHRPFPACGHSPCTFRKSLSCSVAIHISTSTRSPHTARVPSARPSCVTLPTLAAIYLRLKTRRPQLCPPPLAIYSLLETFHSDHLSLNY